MSDPRPNVSALEPSTPEGGKETVRPPFDPQEFARESERVTLPPPPRLPSEAPELVSGTVEDFVPVDEATVPRVAVAQDDLAWFDLTPAVRSILEQIDGHASVETLGQRAGIPLIEAVDAVTELARQGIVVSR